MSDNETDVTYQQPGFAADQVGVSASGLRRLAAIYAEVHGELPRDSADNRLWPTEAVERLKAARALVQSGRARSTKEALEALERGVDVPTEALDTSTPQEGALGVLIEEIRAQRHEISDLRQEVSELRQHLKALEAPTNGKAEYVAEMEQVHADLERRNKYLMGELERRDAETAKVKQPWWWRWLRG